eukprot:GFUD01034034.1.p1 GENE.GFUD01034034.1~~GFUD01034034.1.p1  ORF type:complete len:1306 (-),score=333.18 GFUD01034034.1:153-4070(-)
MDDAVPGHKDQNTETYDLNIEAEVSDNAEMVDQNDFPDELKLEIKTVESIPESKEDADFEDSKCEKENNDMNDNDFVLEIKTVETLNEVVEDESPSAKDYDENLKKPNDDDDFERDLSKVVPNRDQDMCTLEKVVFQNAEDKGNVLKLSYELEKLKVIVLELTNFFPHYQPRTQEKILLNLPLRNKKELDEKDFQVFKSCLEGKQFGSDCSNGGIENLNEILESVSPVLTLQEKLSRSIRNVSDLCNKLIEYVDHLKRKTEKNKDDPKTCETIGVKKVAICRRKNDFPIVGISARDISPIRENFCIKKIISKVEDISKPSDKEPKSRSREKSRGRSKDKGGKVSPIRDNFNVRKVLDSVEKEDKSKSIRKFKPFVRNLVVSIDRLRTNMIFALKSDDKFVLKSDWEFFTNMFKKEALKWKAKEKLNHLENLDVEEHVSKKLGDPIWRFLDSKIMTEDRIARIRVYNKKLEKQFEIKHEIAEFTDEESLATRKLKRGLFFILKNDNNCPVPFEAVKMLDLVDSFHFSGDKSAGGKIIDDTKQDTLDFLQNDDLLPETRDGCELLQKLETAFLSIATNIWNIPQEQKASLGDDILNNLEFEVQKQEFLEQSKILKSNIEVLFEKDDRYCATGDEKYYLDLPGREGEKLLPSEVRNFLRHFQSDQMTKTLQARYEKFKHEQNCDNIKSFNAKLKACVKNVGEKVKNSPKFGSRKGTNDEISTDLRDELRNSREHSRKRKRSRSRSPRSCKGSQNRRITKSPLSSRNRSFRKRSQSPKRRTRSPRRRSRSRDLGRRSRISPQRNSERNERLPFAPFSNMNNPIANNEILSAASNIIGSMTPIAVLQVMAMNGDPRAATALAAANNCSGQDMNTMTNKMQNQKSFFPNQNQGHQGLMANQNCFPGLDSRPMASFGNNSGGAQTAQTNSLLMGENHTFGGKTGQNLGRIGNVGHQQQNEMDFTRNEIECEMMGRSNRLQQNMFHNLAVGEHREDSTGQLGRLGDHSKLNFGQSSDHPMMIPEINQQQQVGASNFSFGRQAEMNKFGNFGGSDTSQNFPSKSNEKSQTQPWTRPKFNPYANQEVAGSNRNLGGWSSGSSLRQGEGMGGNNFCSSSFSSTSLGKTFPTSSTGQQEHFQPSFSRDAPAAQGRPFSEDSSETERRHLGPSSNAQQQYSRNAVQNSRSFQGNNSEVNRSFQGKNPEVSRSFEGNNSEVNRSFQGNSSQINRSFQGNIAGLERSSPGNSSLQERSSSGNSSLQNRSFSGNSYNHSTGAKGPEADLSRSYSQYLDNISGPGTDNRNNLFRSLQGESRR